MTKNEREIIESALLSTDACNWYLYRYSLITAISTQLDTDWIEVGAVLNDLLEEGHTINATKAMFTF